MLAVALLALAALLPARPAAAAEGLPMQGIGFAQAEEGTWLCRHESAEEALACAREHCLEEAPGQECIKTAWCFPAGWSGLMTVWLPDIHGTKVLCGAETEKGLLDALAALCAANSYATTCDLFLTVDPDGNERKVEGVTFPGGAPAEPPAGSEGSGQNGKMQ